MNHEHILWHYVNWPTDKSSPWQLIPDNWPPRQLVPFGYTPQGGPGGLSPGKGIEDIAPDNMFRLG